MHEFGLIFHGKNARISGVLRQRMVLGFKITHKPKKEKTANFLLLFLPTNSTLPAYSESQKKGNKMNGEKKERGY